MISVLRWTVLLLCSLPMAVRCGDFEQDFAVVFITAATEAKHGRFPLDRSLLAQAVERAADAGAKGVILKFFFDQPRTAEGDRRLAIALKRLPVLLQARMDDSEKTPNPLDVRFTLPEAGLPTTVSGRSGWIPLPDFAASAHDVCFVDFNAFPAPVIETYQGKTVKSLLVCAAELATGSKATIHSAQDISLGHQPVPLDASNRVTAPLAVATVPMTFDFNDLLDGSLPASALQNRVVIIGYDGPGIPQVTSPVGTMGAHRLFVLMLKGFYRSAVVEHSP